MLRWLMYFEGVIKQQQKEHSGPFLLGAELSYLDLSLFQVLAGLHYALPKACERHRGSYPFWQTLAQRVEEQAAVAAYLASERRLAFNQDGIFRHYPDLDL